MIRRAMSLAIAAALLVLTLQAAPAAGNEVDVALLAKGTEWHVGAPTTAPKPEIAVAPGDRLVLQVHNHDGMDHTFTFPHFGIDRSLAPGSDANPTIISVSFNTSSADIGRWQFYCAIPGHASGSDENTT